MTLMDDTPLETPHYENPAASDISHRINRRLDFEKQEGIELISKQEPQIENTKKTLQHLEELQPKGKQTDVETKVLTRSYSDRVYETVSMKEQAKEYINKEAQRLEQEDPKNEFQRIEQASGNKYSQNHQDDPESTHELEGKRGRPAKSNKKKLNEI